MRGQYHGTKANARTGGLRGETTDRPSVAAIVVIAVDTGIIEFKVVSIGRSTTTNRGGRPEIAPPGGITTIERAIVVIARTGEGQGGRK